MTHNPIEVSNITKNFGDFKAVAGLSLQLQRARCLAILGPNGAGKTTTLEMLMGLQTPDSGSIKILDMDYESSRRRILERVGIVFQETHLYRKLTIRETFELFASFYEKPRTVDSLLSQLSLQEKADARLETLSGGQKQRCYLGCGLINSPDLLFLDEPTTGLDPQARRAVWDLIRQLKTETGCAIVLTTHSMDEAEQLADDVAIMDHGKIIATGTPKQLIQGIGGVQTLCVTFATQDQTEKAHQFFKAQYDWYSNVRCEENTLEIFTEQAPVHVLALVKDCESRNIPIASLQMRNSTLEDVFLKLTGRRIRDA